MNKNKILLAGKIAKEVREWILPQIKKDMLLLEIAEKIESKIIELGGKPAFPTNLSINEIAAHYTPTYDDETKAHGLLKIDFGVHIDGWCSDNAFSIDLENSEENKKLISASKDALTNAINLIKSSGNKNIDKTKNLEDNSSKKFDEQSEKHLSLSSGERAGKLLTSQIGKIISETISSQRFQPIINLSGHEIDEYDLHAGLTIPNFDNQSRDEIENGLYAIEPFATLSTGTGKIKDGKPSGIYQLTNSKNIRGDLARDILDYIIEEYETLPFCSRWLIKKFGTKALLGLKQLEQNGNLHHFTQLIESSGAKVSQTEHTIFIKDKEIIVTTN